MRIMKIVLPMLLFMSSIGLSQQRMVISYQPGNNFKNTYKYGFLAIHVVPQMAFWLEDTNGNFISNIYVTESSAKNEWHGGFNLRRPEALPIWSHKMGVKYKDGLYMPDKKHPLPDAVTGATNTDKKFIKEWDIPSNLVKGKYYIYAEINNSYDYNSTYKEKLPKSNKYYSAVNGQPSLLYKTEIEMGANIINQKMTVIGHGEVLGKDGSIDPDLSGVKEAMQILEYITISTNSK
jgi:hypothetical protein